MADIFISYKREDRARIERLAEALQARGYTVWWDLELVAGERWAKKIKTELDAAKCVVVAWTENSVAADGIYISTWVEREAKSGDRRGVLVPALLDAGCIAWEHDHLQYAILVDWNADPRHPAFDKLVDGIANHAGGRARPEDVELSAWTAAERAGTAAAYAQFVRAHPTSRFAEVARDRRAEVQEADDWAALGKTPTVVDLTGFLRRWPSGRFADAAEEKIQGLVSLSTPVVPVPPPTSAPDRAPRLQHPEVMVEPTTGMRFLPVAGGTFEMGADDIDSDSRPVHRVTVSSFWLAETPVTNAQYRPFVRASGKEPGYWNDRRYNEDEQPVVGVTWADAVAYCEWLTERLQKGFVARLPSEAWWERAARGDDGRRYPWGDAEPDETRAWYGQDYSKSAPKPVGQYPAGTGPYGHLDLSGNVWEWCSDVWDEAAYKKRPHSHASVDPEVSEGDQARRSVRGGGFGSGPVRLRAAYRIRHHADYDGDVQGFRVCLAPLSTGGSGGRAPGIFWLFRGPI